VRIPMSFYTTPPEKLDVGYQCGDVEMELGFPRTKFARGMAWQGNALRAVTDWGSSAAQLAQPPAGVLQVAPANEGSDQKNGSPRSVRRCLPTVSVHTPIAFVIPGHLPF